jgi:PAS domain S-box-containing protein
MEISESVRNSAERNKTALFEELVFRLSAFFIDLPVEKISHAINDALEQIGSFLHLDRCSLGHVTPDGREMVVKHVWNRGAVPGVLTSYSVNRYPWLLTPFIKGKKLIWTRAEGLPNGSEADIELLEKSGMQSFAGIPVKIAGELKACLGFSKISDAQPFNPEIIERFDRIAIIFGNVLSREYAETKIDQSEQRLRSFMDNSPAFMYIKDASRKHLYANRSLLEYFNISLDEFIGTTTRDFIPENVAQKLEDYDRKVIEKRVSIDTDEFSFKPHGKLLCFKEIKFPIKLYSGEVGVGGIVMNITTLKQKEENLQKAYHEIKLLKDQLKKENIYLRKEIQNEYHFREIIGRSEAMQDVLKKAEQVAATDSTVLILGETGTGKELVARAIHDLSMRKDRLMVKVNCAALPSTLIESELFGREKGAYTGALSQQAGRFETAHGSTIFLDEIGELSPELQAKLLRVLQDGEFERLGSSKTMKVDVRVIAATNRDLEKAVHDGTFREDLYYRLKVFPIYIPPLRERPEDIPPLVWAIVKELGHIMGRRIEEIKKKDMDAVQRYHWPGNVRELRNVLEQAMITSTGKPLNIQIPKLSQERPLFHRKLEDAECEHILSVLEKTKWRISGRNGAADILGLKESTLRARMKKLGIKRPG